MAGDGGPPQGWLSSSEAGERLGVTPEHVAWLARKGHFPILTTAGRRLWFEEDGVAAFARARVAEAERWVSYVEAAQIVGCSPSNIVNAVQRGDISGRRPPRKRGPRGGVASLSRSAVEDYAERWRAQRELAREAQERATAAREPLKPPGPGDVWLSARATSLLLGVSVSRVHQLALADRLPHVRHRGRVWFRRSHMEVAAAARAFARAAAAAEVTG